jgi:cell wall-associated NlpC family hydrolase
MGLTVKSVPMNPVQRGQAQILLGVAHSLAAGSLASVALICAAIGESTLTNLAQPNSDGFWGVLQAGSGAGISSPNFPPPNGWNDSAGMATAFLQGGRGFGNGAPGALHGQGAIAMVRAGITDPGQIAEYCEDSGAAYSFYGQWASEARAIVAAIGGNVSKGGIAGGTTRPDSSSPMPQPKAGGSGTVVDGSANTTYAFSIGGTDNPDEDVWTGINRLAQEVNWYLWSNGEYLYYLDGQEMLAQQPAALIDRVADRGRLISLNLSYDNTSFDYVSDRLRKFTPRRRTKVAIAQSPTEASLEILCGIDEFRSGDLIVLTSCGPGDGSWIVSEVNRSVFAVSSSLTLVPPIAPITEAAAVGTTGSTSSDSQIVSTRGSTNPTGDTTTHRNFKSRQHGTLAKVVQLALQAASLESSQRCFTYISPASGDAPGRINQGHGVLSPPHTFDCSGFVEACYRDAGMGDPAGDTDFEGNSDEIAESTACVQVDPTAAVPGDCVVFPDHVVIYTGGGNCVSMGESGEPAIRTVAEEAAFNNRGITGYYHLKGAR